VLGPVGVRAREGRRCEVVGHGAEASDRGRGGHVVSGFSGVGGSLGIEEELDSYTLADLEFVRPPFEENMLLRI
jgi:hypothetical protein